MLKFKKIKLQECYLFSSGGLGDIILDYFTNKNYLKVIEAHRKYDLKINLILKTTNKFSANIFENNPYFQNVYFEDFSKQEKLNLGFIKFKELFRENLLKEKQMPIFLSNEDKLELEKIPQPYVVLHPFAGEDFRSWNDKIELHNLIDHLINKNFNVVMIGGSHFREALIEDQRSFRKESFNYEKKGFFNTINKAGPALCLSIIERCSYFIGSSSCYLTAAWCLEKKSLAVIPSHNFLPEGNWWGDNIHKKSFVVTMQDFLNFKKYLEEFIK